MAVVVVRLAPAVRAQNESKNNMPSYDSSEFILPSVIGVNPNETHFQMGLVSF